VYIYGFFFVSLLCASVTEPHVGLPEYLTTCIWVHVYTCVLTIPVFMHLWVLYIALLISDNYHPYGVWIRLRSDEQVLQVLSSRPGDSGTSQGTVMGPAG